jgi:hypothetical protein
VLHGGKANEKTKEDVFLKLQPYQQISVQMHKNAKLSARCFGPFKILKKISPVAYKLELPVCHKGLGFIPFFIVVC